MRLNAFIAAARSVILVVYRLSIARKTHACKTTFTSAELFSNHHQVGHPPHPSRSQLTPAPMLRKRKCDHSSQKFPTLNAKFRHTMTEGIHKFSCTVFGCSSWFFYQTLLEDHMRQDHDMWATVSSRFSLSRRSYSKLLTRSQRFLLLDSLTSSSLLFP